MHNAAASFQLMNRARKREPIIFWIIVAIILYFGIGLILFYAGAGFQS